jgi:hypothetical protein
MKQSQNGKPQTGKPQNDKPQKSTLKRHKQNTNQKQNTNLPPPKQQKIQNLTSTLQEKKNGLIITTGDCSDFDGFLALPLYFKTAIEKGYDVAFIMNYPAYFGVDKNLPENITDDNLIKSLISGNAKTANNPKPLQNSITKTANDITNLERIKTKLDKLNSKLKINLDELNELKIDTNSARITSLKDENNNINLFINEIVNKIGKQELGKGYKYSYETFKIFKNISDDTNSGKLFPSESGESGINKLFRSFNIISDKKSRFFNLIEKQFNNINKNSYLTKSGFSGILLLTFISYYIVNKYWELAVGKSGTNSKLHFCIGGINEINPFSVNSIKNEYDVYGNIVYDDHFKTSKSLFGKNNSGQSLVDKYLDTFIEVIQKFTSLNKVLATNYESIYIDMNGSMAWYEGNDMTVLNDKADNVKGVFVMGGVLSYAQVNTLGANPFLNRLSCATMNQLYHPDNTKAFFDKFNDKLFFITNNEINANFNFVTATYEYFFQNMIDIKLLPTDKNYILNKCFDAYYQSRPGDRKPFDVITALALVEKIIQDTNNNAQMTNIKTSSLLYNSEYGITILSHPNDKSKTVKDLFNDFIINGTFNKFDIQKPNSFSEGLIKEATDILPKLSNIPNILYTNVRGLFANNKDTYITNITNIMTSTPMKNTPILVTETFNIDGEISDIKLKIFQKIKDHSGKELFIFGDIEGAIPHSDVIFNSEAPANRIAAKNTVNAMINNPIITIKDKNHLILLGDITDNYKYDIRLLQEIQRLYNEKKNITTIIGNRDINKIRLRDECFIVTNTNELPWITPIKRVTTNNPTYFTELCKDIATNYEFGSTKSYKFLFDLGEIINGNKISNPKKNGRFITNSKKEEVNLKTYSYQPYHWKTPDFKNTSPNDKYTSNNLDRIQTLYVTLGAGDVINNRYEELKALNIIDEKILIDENILNNFKYAALAISNMLMSIKWPTDLITNLHKDVQSLNGLHADYLKNSKLIDIFSYNKANYLISHTGIPPYLSIPFGFAPLLEKPKTLKYQSLDYLNLFINKINTEKTNLIENYLNLEKYTTNAAFIEYLQASLNDDTLVKFVQLSANTGIRIYDDYRAGSTFTTMFGHSINNILLHPYFKEKSLKEKPNSKVGGTYWSDKESFLYIDMVELCNKEIDYNIIGHQPQGLFPTVIQEQNTKETKHVCLDVSMMSRKSHIATGAYAYMHVKGNNINICGKFKCLDNFGINYLDNTNLNQDFKYTIDIDTFITNNDFNNIKDSEYKESFINNSKYTNLKNFIINTETKNKMNNMLLDEFKKYKESHLTFDIYFNTNTKKLQIGEILNEYKNANTLNVSQIPTDKSSNLFDFLKKDITSKLSFNLLNQNIVNNKNIIFGFSNTYTNYCLIEKAASVAAAAEGGKSKKKYTKTPQKLEIGKKSHVIYKGSRGAQYIKKNNTYINIRSLKNKCI